VDVGGGKEEEEEEERNIAHSDDIDTID